MECATVVVLCSQSLERTAEVTDRRKEPRSSQSLSLR